MTKPDRDRLIELMAKAQSIGYSRLSASEKSEFARLSEQDATARGWLDTGFNPRDVFDKHQLKIAKATLKMSDVGARIMGGMTKAEAREVIYRLTGKRAKGNPHHRYRTNSRSRSAISKRGPHVVLERGHGYGKEKVIKRFHTYGEAKSYVLGLKNNSMLYILPARFVNKNPRRRHSRRKR